MKSNVHNSGLLTRSNNEANSEIKFSFTFHSITITTSHPLIYIILTFTGSQLTLFWLLYIEFSVCCIYIFKVFMTITDPTHCEHH